MNRQPILRLEGVTKDFLVKPNALGNTRARLRAVDKVSLSVMPGETLGIVGESGCGKTTLGRLILRLIEPTAGEIHFQGRNITALPRTRLHDIRRELQIVFQDPYSSLNPRMKVRDIIAEPLENFGASGAEIRTRIAEVMEIVKLPLDYSERYPHAFSGGQRQRIGIARALALKPKLLVCDEAVSALDVSVQAQILNLLASIQREMALTLVFISHNLGVIRFLSHRIAVMYLGRIVEEAAETELFRAPRHPYTRALISAIPEPDPRRRGQRQVLQGDIPNPMDPPPGCPFHLRCPKVQEKCRVVSPVLETSGSKHAVACHFPG